MSHLQLSGMSTRFIITFLAASVLAQQQCYFGPGAEHRGPSTLVPCKGSGTSACCLLGDTCLSGNTCYNYETGNVYQYGCTDITYQDQSCPYKCGWNSTKSPWTAMEYCNNVNGINNTWICHAPESCDCAWNSTFDLLVLEPIGCKEMGSNARVALFAPSTLAPYISLPSTYGGSTGYYSTTTESGIATWVSTAIPGYTPDPIVELTTYQAVPTSIVVVNASAVPVSTTLEAARSVSNTVTLSTSTVTIAATRVDEGSSGLSTGAKAGLGAGIGVAALIILALILMTCLSSKYEHDANPSIDTSQQPEMPPEKHSRQHCQDFSPHSEHSMPWRPIGPQTPLYPEQVRSVPVPISATQWSDSQASDLRAAYWGAELPVPRHVHELSAYRSRDNMVDDGLRFF